MIYRSIAEDLSAWKSRPHHPLVLGGLRQVGKTFIVKQFGQDHYAHVIYIDLRADQTVRSAFGNDLDVNQMVTALSARIPDAVFEPHKTLIILDEIQDCPNARSSLKYWDLDGRYDVICTGSFLGVKGFRQPYERGIPVGYEEHMAMFPLTFQEFLRNYGVNRSVMDYVRECFDQAKAVEKTVHASLRTLYLEYLLVGGMPEAVSEFLTNHDINAVRRIQQNILRSIRDDLGRYIDKNGETKINEVLKLRAEACLDSMPAQLSKEYKKFQYSLVNSKARSTDKADALQYLADLGLVLKSYNLREISFPLSGVKIDKEYKAFYADTGLLASQLDTGVSLKILNGELGAYKGAIAENMAAVSLHNSGRGLYYYRGTSGSPELDFVTELSDEPTIIECKASNLKATSFQYVLGHPQKYGKHPAIKIADTNVGHGEGFQTYPLYYCGFLENKPAVWKLPAVDLSALNAVGEMMNAD